MYFMLEIDHCLSNPCDTNAICSNTRNSFSCKCKAGFVGNGIQCKGIEQFFSVVLFLTFGLDHVYNRNITRPIFFSLQ